MSPASQLPLGRRFGGSGRAGRGRGTRGGVAVRAGSGTSLSSAARIGRPTGISVPPNHLCSLGGGEGVKGSHPFSSGRGGAPESSGQPSSARCGTLGPDASGGVNLRSLSSFMGNLLRVKFCKRGDSTELLRLFPNLSRSGIAAAPDEAPPLEGRRFWRGEAPPISDCFHSSQFSSFLRLTMEFGFCQIFPSPKKTRLLSGGFW